MAIGLDPKQMVSSDELLMSQVVQQEALTKLHMEKVILANEEFLEMVEVVDREMKEKEWRCLNIREKKCCYDRSMF